MPLQKRRPRLQRMAVGSGNHTITPRDLEIIATIARYLFISTTLLIHLIAGSVRGILNRLRVLFDLGLVNRFALSPNHECTYYLDNLDALRLLVARDGVSSEDLDWEAVRNNREKPPSPLFLAHELMISRFHSMLELACRRSGGKVELASWRQGARLWDNVLIEEEHQIQRLPHRPDAFFTLRYSETGEQQSFLYEADRKTSDTTKFRRKLRAHYHYIVAQKKHREKYAPRIRAVLIETLDAAWAMQLREAARDPAVSGRKPSALFWFSTAQIFMQNRPVLVGRRSQEKPRFLLEPELIFAPIWATPASEHLHSLLEDFEAPVSPVLPAAATVSPELDDLEL